MTLKKSVLFGVLLASVLIGQQAYAQSTTSAKDAPVLVPMPKDIQCELSGMSFQSVVGANAQLTETSGSVDAVTCWIAGKTPEKKKDVSLASNDITRGMLTTKDFGKWKVTPQNSIYASGLRISVRRDKVSSLRAYLQKPEVVKGDEHAPSATQPADAYVSLPDNADCSFRGIEYESVVGSTSTNGSVEGVTCWITGKTPEQKKEIPLGSTEIKDGMLPTKDFGSLKITVSNSLVSVGIGISIRRDKLASFTAFLQK